MIKKFVFPIDEAVYENVTTALHKSLAKREKDRKNILQIMLSAEEVLGKMLESNEKQEGTVRLYVSRILGNIKVTLACSGKEFELVTNTEMGWDDPGEDMGEESQGRIREILINSFSKNLVYHHRSGVNRVTIKGKQN